MLNSFLSPLKIQSTLFPTCSFLHQPVPNKSTASSQHQDHSWGTSCPPKQVHAPCTAELVISHRAEAWVA